MRKERKKRMVSFEEFEAYSKHRVFNGNALFRLLNNPDLKLLPPRTPKKKA